MYATTLKNQIITIKQKFIFLLVPREGAFKSFIT